jgi:ATP-dependent Lon protease
MTDPAYGEVQVPDSTQNGKDPVTVPATLAILPLRGVVVYPLTFQALNVGQPRSLRLVDEANLGKWPIGLVASRNAEMEEPGPEDVHRVGVLAAIQRMIRAPDGTVRLLVQGLERIKIEEWIAEEPYLRARVSALPDEVEDSVEVQALMRNAVELLRRLAALVSQLPEELVMAAMILASWSTLFPPTSASTSPMPRRSWRSTPCAKS